MFNVGAGELLLIMVLALVVLGPDKLPDAMRKAGRFVGEVRRMSSGFQNEVRSAMNIDQIKRDIIAGGAGPSLPPLESDVRASNPTPAPTPPAGPAADGSSPAA